MKFHIANALLQTQQAVRGRVPAPRKGVDKSKKKTIIKERKKQIKPRRHAEFISASHLVSVLESGEILKSSSG